MPNDWKESQMVTGRTYRLGFSDYESVEVEMALYVTEGQYGNGTTVTMCAKRSMPEQFDTRYDTTLMADGSNFGKWCEGFLRDRFGERLTEITQI